MDIETTAIVTEGQQWQQDLPELGDLEVLVAPWDNKAFKRALQKKLQALPRGLRAGGNIDPATFDRCTGEVMPGTIIFGWKNFHLGGKPVEFSDAIAKTYLADPKFRVVFDGVIVAAKRVMEGDLADREAVEGN